MENLSEHARAAAQTIKAWCCDITTRELTAHSLDNILFQGRVVNSFSLTMSVLQELASHHLVYLLNRADGKVSVIPGPGMDTV